MADRERLQKLLNAKASMASIRSKLEAQEAQIEAKLAQALMADQKTALFNVSNFPLFPPPPTPAPARSGFSNRTISTNKRVESTKTTSEGRWSDLIKKFNPANWFSPKTEDAVNSVPDNSVVEDGDTLRLSSFETLVFSDGPEAPGAEGLSLNNSIGEQYTDIQMDLDSALTDLDTSTLFEDGPPALISDVKSEPRDGDFSLFLDQESMSTDVVNEQVDAADSESEMIEFATRPDIVRRWSPKRDHEGTVTFKRREKRKAAEMMEEDIGPRFVSSLESISAFDLNTIHALADPFLVDEVKLHAQYCAPVTIVPDDERDYFEDFANAAFPEWTQAKQLARRLINLNDPEIERHIQLVRDANSEQDLYTPLQYLANRAFGIGAQDGSTLLTMISTYNKPVQGTAENRKMDLVAIALASGEEVPKEVNSSRVVFVVEVKFDRDGKSLAPKLHDITSSEQMSSSFSRPDTVGEESSLDPIQQTSDYLGHILTSQSPHRRFCFGLLITCTRIRLIYADRGGCMISAECDFSDDFSVPLAAMIALQRSQGEYAGDEPALSLLDRKGSKIPRTAFRTSEFVWRTGAISTMAKPVLPFTVAVQSASDPSHFFPVQAYGCNMTGRPPAISEFVAVSLKTKPTGSEGVSTRPTLPRHHKDTGAEKTHGIAVAERSKSVGKRNGNCPRQFVPRSLFGSAIARFLCVAESDEDKEWTLQLSWQPSMQLSKASLLQRLNQLGINGVPTLMGSYDIAEMDLGLVRSRLRQAFETLPSVRDVNLVLRAEVWKEDCIPLHSVIEIRSLLSAYRSVILTLQTLHEIGVVHTNVSDANLMVKRDDHTESVVIGFDMAQFHEQSNPPHPLKKMRFATPDSSTDPKGPFAPLTPEIFGERRQAAPHVAFLPLDKCADVFPAPRPHHDYESLAWTFFFHLGSYRRGRRIINSGLDKWYTGSWSTIKKQKRGFLAEEAKIPQVAVGFAAALRIKSEPLHRLSQAWAERLSSGLPLTSGFMLATLQDADSAYAT